MPWKSNVPNLLTGRYIFERKKNTMFICFSNLRSISLLLFHREEFLIHKLSCPPYSVFGSSQPIWYPSKEMTPGTEHNIFFPLSLYVHVYLLWCSCCKHGFFSSFKRYLKCNTHLKSHMQTQYKPERM